MINVKAILKQTRCGQFTFQQRQRGAGVLPYRERKGGARGGCQEQVGGCRLLNPAWPSEGAGRWGIMRSLLEAALLVGGLWGRASGHAYPTPSALQPGVASGPTCASIRRPCISLRRKS